METKIILYTTHCPMCNSLKRQLDLNGVKYEECTDVEKMKELGMTHAPALMVENELLDFSKALKWVRARKVDA